MLKLKSNLTASDQLGPDFESAASKLFLTHTNRGVFPFFFFF